MNALLTLVMMVVAALLVRFLWHDLHTATQLAVLGAKQKSHTKMMKSLPPFLVLGCLLLYLLLDIGAVFGWIPFIIIAAFGTFAAYASWTFAARIVAVKRRPAHKIAPLVDEKMDFGLYLAMSLTLTLFFGWLAITEFGEVTGFW